MCHWKGLLIQERYRVALGNNHPWILGDSLDLIIITQFLEKYEGLLPIHHFSLSTEVSPSSVPLDKTSIPSLESMSVSCLFGPYLNHNSMVSTY